MQLDTSVDTVLLSVTQPACTVLIMDYVAINIRGVSLFSPQSKWTGKPHPPFLTMQHHKMLPILFLPILNTRSMQSVFGASAAR